MTSTIAPHGGKLTSRYVQGRRTAELTKEAAGLVSLPLPPRGVRRHPARPSVLNSAIDLPFLTRRKTAPYDHSDPAIICSAVARWRGLI